MKGAEMVHRKYAGEMGAVQTTRQPQESSLEVEGRPVPKSLSANTVV